MTDAYMQMVRQGINPGFGGRRKQLIKSKSLFFYFNKVKQCSSKEYFRDTMQKFLVFISTVVLKMNKIMPRLPTRACQPDRPAAPVHRTKQMRRKGLSCKLSHGSATHTHYQNPHRTPRSLQERGGGR